MTAQANTRANRKPAPPPTPGHALARSFLALSLLWFVLPWLVGLPVTSGHRWYGPPPLEARAQLRSIRARLQRGGADAMNYLFPEGKLFSWSFYGFSLVNVATATPEDAALRPFARAELERVIRMVEAEADAGQFRRSKDLTPKGGIIPAAHANLLRAGYILLGGASQEIAAAFHQTSALLFSEFMSSPVVSLETFPGMIWPVDNVCALESLRLHDVLYGTTYRRACTRWTKWMADHLDAKTGLMVAQVAPTGETLDPPRGCALSWSLAFMPGFAPELARAQYERYRSDWFVHVCGLAGAREWPPGKERGADVDSGPVAFGIGAAASGLGMAAAKANGDPDNLTGMLRGMELLAVPVWSPEGKHYFLRFALLADELALWGKTIRVWDKPSAEDHPASWAGPDLGPFWILYLILLALTAAALFFTARSALRKIRGARRNPDRWATRHTLVFACQVAVIAAWLILPAMDWVCAALVIGVVSILERRLLVGRAP